MLHLLGTTFNDTGDVPVPLPDKEVIGFSFANFYE
jgi:hypothetical protein